MVLGLLELAQCGLELCRSLADTLLKLGVQIANLFFGFFDRGNVKCGPHDPYGTALLIGNDLSPSVKRTNASIRANDSVVEIQRRLVLIGGIHQAIHPFSIIGMDAFQKPLVGCLELLGREAVNLVELIGPGDDIGGDIPFPDAEMGNLLRLKKRASAFL